MPLLKVDQILTANDIATKDVHVPEWGGDVRVRQMTVAERNEFVKRSGSEERESVGVWLLVRLCIDENGAPLFKPEDVEALQKRNYKAVDSVVEAILAVNMMDGKAVEDAAKN